VFWDYVVVCCGVFLSVAVWELIVFATSGSVRGYLCVTVCCGRLQCVVV